MCQPDLLVDDEAQNEPKLPTPRRGVGVVWFIIAIVSSFAGNLAILTFDNFISSSIFYFFLVGSIVLHSVMYAHLYYIDYAYLCGRHAVSYPIGRIAKFRMDVITVTAALTLRLYLEFNWTYFCGLVSYTIEYQAIRQLLHAPSDIGFLDMLVEVAMQCAVFFSGHDINSSLLVFTSCFGVILFRYFIYSVPSTTPVQSIGTKEVLVGC